MTTAATLQAPVGTSLHALVKGFILTHQTDGKSQKTVQYYRDNLRRFLWYADTHDFPDDPASITDWHVRDFLGYVGSETNRWGLSGRGSETSRRQATHATVRHYFVVLSCFFNWALREGFISTTPLARIKIPRASRRRPIREREGYPHRAASRRLGRAHRGG